MLKNRLYFAILCFINRIECKMEPFVVGGKNAAIKDFPHSVLIDVLCAPVKTYEPITHWVCGASIVNDKIVLTAAHCLYGCTAHSTIAAFVGNAHKKKGTMSSAYSFYIHEKYNDRKAAYDIGLVRLKTALIFNQNVKRIALMSKPPYNEKAQVAGWGVTDEYKSTNTMILKYVDQYVWTASACKQVIHSMPRGTICASSGNINSYSSRGDSGSALMVRGYIQIGIVSYKMPKVSRSLVVYTDTGYFYDWIKKNSRRLYCA